MTNVYVQNYVRKVRKIKCVDLKVKNNSYYVDLV